MVAGAVIAPACNTLIDSTILLPDWLPADFPMIVREWTYEVGKYGAGVLHQVAVA